MSKYVNIEDIQKIISKDGTVRLTYNVTEMNDIIHPYSVPGYEYLSGEFTGFIERFKTVLPKKMPIVLEITGKEFEDKEKKIIDKATWTHYGLELSAASRNLKKMRLRMFIYIILMVLSSSLLFLASRVSIEVVTNYAYILFWFFGYRILTHLILDYRPIHREYLWFRKLSAIKLVFADGMQQAIDAKDVERETAFYAREAARLTKKDSFVEDVLMEESCVSLGCRIEHIEDVVLPSGAAGLEIVSDEMADYLMSAIPFIRQRSITRLTIEGGNFTEKEQQRIALALRNYLAFTISDQNARRRENRGISLLFTIGLIISTILLFVFGSKVGLAVHEFILVSFWFFADYLLEFAILTRAEIRNQKKTLEKLADMDITFESPR